MNIRIKSIEHSSQQRWRLLCLKKYKFSQQIIVYLSIFNIRSLINLHILGILVENFVVGGGGEGKAIHGAVAAWPQFGKGSSVLVSDKLYQKPL